MDWLKVLENSVYLLALLNPPSKILFLSTYEPELEMRIFSIVTLALASSFALPFTSFTAFAIVGQFVLEQIFRISLYSLKITGGLVIFFIGWMAVREGKFFQKRENELRNDFTELSIVPLAAPLIAGPGTITIAISFSAQYGHLFVLMLFSRPFSRLFQKLHLVGPLIRITGLIVSAVAVQMILDGAGEWLAGRIG